MTSRLPRLAAACAGLFAFAAQAHEAHEATSLLAGLAHPLAADHLFVAAAVGLWSAFALRGRMAALTAAAFTAGAVLPMLAWVAGLQFAAPEHALALTVLLAAALLALTGAGRQAGTTAVAAALFVTGIAHGAAHAAEAPALAGGYLTGLALTTLGLQALGAACALHLRARFERAAPRLLAAAGGALGCTGAWLLAQL